METHWGELPVCDAHVHFFSNRFFAGLAEQKGLTAEALQPLLGWEIPGPDITLLADRWTEELDRHHVDCAALIASVPGDHASVMDAVRRHPSRFRGYMMVNPVGAECLAHIEAALTSGLMHGLCFFPAMHRYSVQDGSVGALLDRVSAARPSTVIFVHCGVLSVGVRKKLGLPSLFDMRFSNPIDLHAVALRYPQLRFVVPHFGAGYFREALMLCDLCPNVYLDTSSTNGWMRYEEAHLDLRTVFRRALDVVGPQRLLFGTDSSFFPRGWVGNIFEVQTKALYELGVDARAARMILHDNFIRLFE